MADRDQKVSKPARKRRSRKAEATPAPETTETGEQSPQSEPVPDAAPAADAAPVPAANNDTTEDSTGEPRRGWWQRTFG